MRAPRFSACDNSSRITNPAPSAMTNPDLEASNGRDALAGSLLKVVAKAFALLC